jgi:cytochrome c553
MKMIHALLSGALAAVLLSAPAIAQNMTAAQVDQFVQAQCAVCHGARGESTQGQFPQLAGQNVAYLRKQLEDFKAGRRQNEAMTPISQSLTEAQMVSLAEFFQKQLPQTHPSDDDLLNQVGRYVYERGNIYNKVPACLSCHSATGAGNQRLPRLASQHPRYIEHQLRLFRSKQRQNDTGAMAFVTEGLSELELVAVSAYIGGMKTSPPPAIKKGTAP